MTKYITTLNKIREHSPCEDGWIKLLKHLGKTKADDEPLDLLTILESNGLDDALWCLRTLPKEHHLMMHSLACDFAERALRFVTPSETRPAAAIAAKRAWLRGEITDEQLDAARDAARAAARAAWAAEVSWKTAHFRSVLTQENQP